MKAFVPAQASRHCDANMLLHITRAQMRFQGIEQRVLGWQPNCLIPACSYYLSGGRKGSPPSSEQGNEHIGTWWHNVDGKAIGFLISHYHQAIPNPIHQRSEANSGAPIVSGAAQISAMTQESKCASRIQTNLRPGHHAVVCTHVTQALKYPVYSYSSSRPFAISSIAKGFSFLFLLFSVPSPFLFSSLSLLFVLFNVLAENVFQWFNLPWVWA